MSMVSSAALRLASASSVTTDFCLQSAEKDIKWIALHYVNTNVQNQWNSLTTAEDPYTWEEMKAEIIDSYPECKGSIAALERLDLEDIKPLKVYILGFRGHLKKLLPTTLQTVKLLGYSWRDSPRNHREKSGMWFVLALYKTAKKEWEDANPNKAWSDLVEAANKIMEDESSTFYGNHERSQEDKKKTSVLIHGVELEPESHTFKQLVEKMGKLESNMEIRRSWS
ncbi:hypothetical protein B0H19DRAFT_1071738 [Mycena capillaripes]|nr:hypothetical protein B0H19DRAFT_1071738 [Mycena capillaripes]